MAASSSSCVQQKHDVFLSFRGEDTRNNFTSHLHAVLKHNKIDTFVDYQLPKGEEISAELKIAIEKSKISIIVFSKQYAFSSWCLEELCKILECKERNKQKVVPIFYHMNPSDVRKQQGSFKEAFVEHKKHKDRRDKMDKWRTALAKFGEISGYHLQDDRPEAEVVEDIVKNIWAQLNPELSSYVKGLVGMDSRIKELKKLLKFMKSDGVRIIGIWGMPGVGKTTTADALFKDISSQFDASYFLADVREQSLRNGLGYARNEIFRKISKKNLESGTPFIRGTYITKWLHSRKVLIVLDDVNNAQQVRWLIEDRSYFSPGSTIIITSRDREVLVGIADKIYKVEKLTSDQAHELLNQHASRGNRSKSIALNMSLSSLRLVQYVDGIPSALIILCSVLNYVEERMWEGALMKQIYKELKISYDELEKIEKAIFLDVACFFKGEDKNHVADILDGCGFVAHTGITALINKSLITILNNNLQMHNLIQEMGREIVRKESIYPNERSRLWIYDDIDDILTTNQATEKVEGIFLNMSEEPIRISPEAFSKMCNLRLLKICSPYSEEDYAVHTPVSFQIRSHKLAYLNWYHYPLESLPSNFDLKNLVELHINHNHVIQLWEGTPRLQKLKWIDLSYSQRLKEMPDFSKAPNLVRINLVGCTSLLEIPSTAGSLPNLQVVCLSGCSNLKFFPLLSQNVEELHLDGTAIEEVPSEIQNYSRLIKLNMKNCKRLKNLPSFRFKLRSLAFLDLSGCPRLESVLELPPNLQYLDAHDCTLLKAESSSFLISRGWGQRFIFTNCIKFDQNTIWCQTQLSFQQTATTDVKRYHKNKKQDLRPRFSSISICFPGSEIPECFDCKNPGSSVTTLLPPHLHKNKFVGFALCAVVAFEEYNKDLGFTVECLCNFKTQGDDCHDSLSFLPVWDKSDSPRSIGSDHVFFGYDFYLYSDWYRGEIKYHLCEASFEFSACDSHSGNPLDSCIFKKCGVCLLYAQDDLSEIEIVDDSESDARECNPPMIHFSSPDNSHFLSDGITTSSPHDEADPSGNFSSPEDPHFLSDGITTTSPRDEAKPSGNCSSPEDPQFLIDGITTTSPRDEAEPSGNCSSPEDPHFLSDGITTTSPRDEASLVRISALKRKTLVVAHWLNKFLFGHHNSDLSC